MIQFAREKGVNCTWTECKKAINAYAITNEIEPVETNNKRTSSVLSLGVGQKIEAAKRYSRPSSKLKKSTHPSWQVSQSSNTNTIQDELQQIEENDVVNLKDVEEEPQDLRVHDEDEEEEEEVFIHPSAEQNANAFEALLSGHGSIKHRLCAMDYLCDNLESIDIDADNGKVLVHAFADQILHIDHVFNKNEVRNKAVDYIADVVIHCLDAFTRTKMLQEEIEDFVHDSMPEVLDNLYVCTCLSI